MSVAPNPAERMWPWLAARYTEALRYRKSRTMSAARLSTQLPRTFPTAMSGTPATVTAVTPLTNSGREVTVASRINPIHPRDHPVRAAMISA
jgi:hypothetical protein